MVVKIYAVTFVIGCVDQMFTPMQIDKKASQKKSRMYVLFIDLEKA